MRFFTTCIVPNARDELVTVKVLHNSIDFDGHKLRFDAGRIGSEGDQLSIIAGEQDPLSGKWTSKYRGPLRDFRDQRIRYDNGRPRVDPRTPDAPTWPRNLRSFTTVFDGHTNAHYLPEERGFYPEGYIFAETENRQLDSLYYRAILLAYRPSRLGIAAENCSVVPEPRYLDSTECVVMLDSGGLGRQYWMNAEKDFLVKRYVENTDVLGALVKTQIDISYEHDERHGWIPAAWHTVFYDLHGLVEQYSPSIVTEYRINEAISSDRFRLSFPPQTWMYDQSRSERYIAMDNGGKRMITREELKRGVRYDELLSSDSGMAGLGWSLQDDLPSNRYWYVAVAVLLGLAAVFRRRQYLRRIRSGLAK